MEPQPTVLEFLDRMARDDARGALDLIADDIVYTNVGLPTLRGRKAVRRVLLGLERPALGFGVTTINIAATGPVVLTERIDEIRVGRLHVQFWVCGRFEVHEGRITLWRDYFDQFDIAKGLLRGIVALAIPGLQKPLPRPAAVGADRTATTT